MGTLAILTKNNKNLKWGSRGFALETGGRRNILLWHSLRPVQNDGQVQGYGGNPKKSWPFFIGSGTNEPARRPFGQMEWILPRFKRRPGCVAFFRPGDCHFSGKGLP
jgi:hypothetical protein